MSNYTKSDFRELSWSEYLETIDVLYKNISELIKNKNLKIHVVAPILRGGAIPAQYIGYKLGVLRFLSIQYKYFKQGNEYKIQKIGGTKLEKGFEIKDGENILVVENNHCFGTTAKTIVDELKQTYPNSKIIYAAAYLDYTYKDSVSADFVLYGAYTNETNKLPPDKAVEMKLSNKFSLFPWENIDEELAAVNSEFFDYNL